MTTDWPPQPGTRFDRRGVPIYPGDVLKTFHFVDYRGHKHWLYHVAVMRDGGMWMEPARWLEPKVKRDGGDCWLTTDQATNAQVVQGYGPKPYWDYRDRPRVKKEKVNDHANG